MRFPGKKCVKTMKKIGNVSKKPLDKNEPEIGFFVSELSLCTQTDRKFAKKIACKLDANLHSYRCKYSKS